MKKRFIILLVALFVFGGTIGAYAWWDRLQQGANNQELELGYGVRLVLENQETEGTDILVPSGSFYANVDGYTTEIVFTYELNLEEELGAFDLLMNVKNLKVGGVDYNSAASVHGPLSVVVANDQSVAFVVEEGVYVNTVTSANTAMRFNNILSDTDTIVITITFSLTDHTVDAGFDGDLVAAYAALAGATITFDVEFIVPTFAQQSANQ